MQQHSYVHPCRAAVLRRQIYISTAGRSRRLRPFIAPQRQQHYSGPQLWGFQPGCGHTTGARLPSQGIGGHLPEARDMDDLPAAQQQLPDAAHAADHPGDTAGPPATGCRSPAEAVARSIFNSLMDDLEHACGGTVGAAPVQRDTSLQPRPLWQNLLRKEFASWKRLWRSQTSSWRRLRRVRHVSEMMSTLHVPLHEVITVQTVRQVRCHRRGGSCLVTAGRYS